MHQRHLPASPNWYCSRCSDINGKGVLGFGAKNTIYLLNVTASSPAVTGELTGHTERVSGFAFCPHDGQERICASTSDDKTVKIWDAGQKILLKEHNVHQSTISAVHWSPVQKLLLVTGDEKGIVVCYWFSSNDTQSFFPEPRTIFCLSCSPHEENYIAVGYKDGMIVVIDISKKGEVIHRLRGHDDEIHALAWCPQPREETKMISEMSLIRSIDGSNGVTEAAEMGCYLASGSRDQTVRIWSTARGKGVMTLKLPFLKRRGAGVDPVVKERLWLTVHWPKGQPSQIVSSCFGGEIIMWDLMKSGKQKWSLLGSSSDGQNHSRIVFNMSSFRSGDRELLLSTSMDREIKCWDLASLECCWTLPTLGGFVYCLSFSPVGTGCLALGIGDSMIRVWNTLSIQNQYDIKTFWQGIKSKVTALAWHPIKEGTLAFGTDDGKVGINEVYSNKPPQISSTYHHRTVYSLSWGPPVPPMSFGGSGDKPSYSLYSCAGEGVIFQHDPWKLSGEASNIDKLIRDTNNIKHKIPPHTDLSWKPDGSVLAIGNEDGSIEVLKAPMLKLLCTVQQHHKIINSLRWHHEHSSQNELQYLLASGSSNAIVYVHDLKSVIETPSESPVLMTEPFRTLSGHTNKITSLAWSPHHDGRLVTVCYDGTAQVWDVLKEEPVCNYRGHSGRLLCVQWSTVHPDLVWTGGDDFTLHEWAVSKQEHVTPPKSKKRAEMEKKRGPQKKSKKKKVAPEKGRMKAEERELPLGEEIKGAAEEGQSENDKEEEERENTDGPSVTGNGPSFLLLWYFVYIIFFILDLSLKKRKPRSILPLSTSMDHRPKEELQQDCLTLAAVRYSHGNGTCVPGSGAHIQLGLFTDRDALYRMFQEEGDHVEAGHYDSMVYLRLWKGDLIGAITLAAEKGELTDHLLSLAPMAGYQVWARTVEAYVKQLCHHEQFLKAASHLVSIHKLYEAINLLKSHQLYREAIALARARLQPEDPVLKNLYMSWAAVLEKDGHYATAAKCYLAADSNFDAAKVIAKKGDVISLRTAANLAQISGESELAHSLSLRCAKDLMLFQDWAAAQEVLRTQDSLLGHRLVFSVNEILTQRLADTDVVTWSVASSHTWSKSCEENFLSMVHRVWQSEFGVAATDLVQVKMLHQQLRTVENPPATTSVPLKQLLFHISLDVTLCALSQLLCDWPSVLEELLQALTRGYEAGHFTLMAEIISYFFHVGLFHLCLCSIKLDSTDERSLVISQSVEALVCYQLMYKKWWNYSAETSALTNNTISNGHRLTEKNHSEVEANCNGEAQSDVIFSEGFWKVLLSEPHANLQATQRAIAEIQRRVTSLIQQHNPCKDTNANISNSSFLSLLSSESLSTLTARVAEHHKALAAIPELVKKYPFPDVMECCIVLLHMEKHFSPFPPHIHSKATTLLCKYGTTELLCKSWKRLTQ
uniref:Gem nuclear organelle associated protein 5 n=1 Tax=Sinocyclocheilus grahami TaxID=75366 RepID=A0A672SYA2_SINGR